MLVDMADAKTVAVMDGIKMFHHPELVACGVTVGLEFARRNKGGDPVLKHHGYPAAAVVRKTSEEERRWGAPDAVVRYDLSTWNSQADVHRAAVLDHELQHLEVVRDKDGNPKADNLGRPVLRLRHHDWQLGGFGVIAERHGEHALEVVGYRQAAARYTQLRFDFTGGYDPEFDEAGAPPAQASRVA